MSKYKKYKQKKPFIKPPKRIKRVRWSVDSGNSAKHEASKKTAITIVFIILVGAIGFAGYFIAPPFIDLISDWGVKDETTLYTPDSFNTTTNVPPKTSSVVAESISTPPPAPKLNAFGGDAVFLDYSVLKNKQTFISALEKISEKGYSSVVIELKNDDGEIWYDSQIDSLKNLLGRNKIVKGTLTLAEILLECTNFGINPSARIFALDDQVAALDKELAIGFPYYFESSSSPKYWADPRKTETCVYLGSLTKEISDAGFENIIVSGLRYPPFSSQYYNNLAGFSEILNVSARYIYLENVLTAIKSGANYSSVFVEFDALDYNKTSTLSNPIFSSSAEFITSSFSNLGINLLVSFDATTSEKEVNGEIIKSGKQIFSDIQKDFKDKSDVYPLIKKGSFKFQDGDVVFINADVEDIPISTTTSSSSYSKPSTPAGNTTLPIVPPQTTALSDDVITTTPFEETNVTTPPPETTTDDPLINFTLPPHSTSTESLDE